MYKERIETACAYGTTIITHEISLIQQATPAQIGSIIDLRTLAEPWMLKPLTPEEIKAKIREFYIATMHGIPVGCCRIMENHYSPYELGSLISNAKWVWREIIWFAERFAEQRGKLIMAITRNSDLITTLRNRNWIHANDLYERRLWKSVPGSDLWIHI